MLAKVTNKDTIMSIGCLVERVSFKGEMQPIQ